MKINLFELFVLTELKIQSQVIIDISNMNTIASTEPILEISPQLSSDFNRYVVTPLTSVHVNPLMVLDVDGKILSFVFQHEVKDGSRDTAYSLMKMQDHCHICANRFGILSTVSDMDGSICSPFKDISREYIHHENYFQMADFAACACKNPITQLILLQKPTVLGHVTEVGTWNHIVRSVNPEQITTCTDGNRIHLIKNSIHRYVISGLFERFMDRLIIQGSSSLGLMTNCLKKAPYGHKFIPAVNWCTAVLDDVAIHSKKWTHFSPKEKIGFAVKHIIRAGLAKDVQGSVALLFQTANNNIIGLLEDATSEDAMTELCAERLSPQTYQRRTADASEGQILNAIKHLGDFTNTILNETRAKELIPEMVCHKRNIQAELSSSSSLSSLSSSLSGFATQMTKAQKQSNQETSSSFASRCNKAAIDVEIQNIDSIKKFVEFSRKNSDIKVEISLNSSTIVYAAETTLSKEKISHRNLWAFLSGRAKKDFGLSELSDQWAEVTHTIPMYEYIIGYKNTIFVISGINPKSDFRNCCFPEFLMPEYRRICGSAFEGLNKTTPISISDGPLMVGIGSSVKDDINTLSRPIQLRVNGIPITLKTL